MNNEWFQKHHESMITNMNEQMKIFNEFKAIMGIDILSFLELYKSGIIQVPKLHELADGCNEIGVNRIINIFRYLDKDNAQLMKKLKHNDENILRKLIRKFIRKLRKK